MTLAAGIAIVGVWGMVALVSFGARKSGNVDLAIIFGFIAATVSTIAIVVNR